MSWSCAKLASNTARLKAATSNPSASQASAARAAFSEARGKTVGRANGRCSRAQVRSTSRHM